jgi:hypothetical protein
MYTNELTLLKNVREQFLKADGLNRYEAGSSCYYRPEYNDIGCAIGCLLTEEDAEEWDAFCDTAIKNIYHEHYDNYAEYFSDDMIGLLADLQDHHDNCESYERFMQFLDNAIAERE